MRLLFDLSPASFYPGGIGSYINNLLGNLQLACTTTKDIEIRTTDLPKLIRPDKSRGISHKAKVAAWDTYYQHVTLPIKSLVQQIDVLHLTGFRTPIAISTPTVTTIYDVIPLLHPQYLRSRDNLILGFYLRISAQRAKHIITISESSRKDICKVLGVSPDKVTVTYLAAPNHFAPANLEMASKVVANLGIPTPYILSVGNVEPRKNLSVLLNAFALLKQRDNIAHHLVLVGKAGPLAKPILDIANNMGIKDSIHFTGFVQDDELIALYSAASAFAYLSRYEGFGIPPLEAMSCGCPVVTSNSSSLPEVVGDAGILIPPDEPEQAANALLEVLNNISISQALRERGLKRAQSFSWERCASETIEVYRRVCSK
jgi:glycosyltransferase involved in cell wall biosynthesis